MFRGWGGKPAISPWAAVGRCSAATNGFLKTLYRPQQCLYFLPLPQGQGSLRPTFGPVRTGLAFSATAAAASLTTSLALACAPPELAVFVPPKALAA
jgi:hypothetical protein